jgi:hypothetical protein
MSEMPCLTEIMVETVRGPKCSEDPYSTKCSGSLLSVRRTALILEFGCFLGEKLCIEEEVIRLEFGCFSKWKQSRLTHHTYL